VEETPKQKRTQEEKSRALRKARKDVERRSKADYERYWRKRNYRLKAEGWLPVFIDGYHIEESSSD
jgi:exopolysaccharide biosynthesis predicted pyruvyltransferase EpsI